MTALTMPRTKQTRKRSRAQKPAADAAAVSDRKPVCILPKPCQKVDEASYVIRLNACAAAAFRETRLAKRLREDTACGVDKFRQLDDCDKTHRLCLLLVSSMPQVAGLMPDYAYTSAFCRQLVMTNFASMMYVPWQVALRYNLYEVFVEQLGTLIRYVPLAFRSERVRALAIRQCANDPLTMAEADVSPEENVAVSVLAEGFVC